MFVVLQGESKVVIPFILAKDYHAAETTCNITMHKLFQRAMSVRNNIISNNDVQ